MQMSCLLGQVFCYYCTGWWTRTAVAQYRCFASIGHSLCNAHSPTHCSIILPCSLTSSFAFQIGVYMQWRIQGGGKVWPPPLGGRKRNDSTVNLSKSNDLPPPYRRRLR